MAPVAEWKPCEVLRDGRWYPGFVERWRHDERGWRGLARYTTAPGFTYITWEPAEKLRSADAFG